MTAAHRLKALLAPASIAVVGASDTPGKVGTSIFRNLLEHRFSGSFYPVNQKSSTFSGKSSSER